MKQKATAVILKNENLSKNVDKRNTTTTVIGINVDIPTSN